MNQPLRETNIPVLPAPGRGKVRDIYNLGKRLLVVATDRVSAFDRILKDPIPGKGRILTEMSVFWFNLVSDIVPNHLIAVDIDDILNELDEFPNLALYRDQLEGRSMLVQKAERLDAECIVRGHITGSGWNDYLDTGMICGITLPVGLLESQKLPENLFTPSTKNDSGHDENVSFEVIAELVGRETAVKMRNISLSVYEKARIFAAERGIIIADTKFEFGIINGVISLIDELLTPDSSRYWPAAEFQPGRPQRSFDKQYLRDYLKGLGWKGDTEAPDLPQGIIEGTAKKYREIRDLLLAE